MDARKLKTTPTRRVLVHGLVYFGRVFADFMSGDGWDFQYFPDHGWRNLASMARALNSCDLVYQIGGRVTVGKFLRAAKLLRKDRVIMHWVGSDTLDQKEDALAGKTDPWVLKSIRHWADSDWILDEVNALGVSADLVPFSSPRVPESPSPGAREFSVLVYVPSVERCELYGLDLILQVARELPQIPFELVGLRDGPVVNPPANIRFHKRIPELTEFYKRASVVWRAARHDGLSWMVLEALGHGRHVMWAYPFPGCLRVSSVAEAKNHILRLCRLHQENKLESNREGSCFIAGSIYHPRRFKQHIRSRLEQVLHPD